MKIIYYNIHYYSESIFAFILFVLFALSLFTLLFSASKWGASENKNDDNNNFKILLLNLLFCFLFFINFLAIYNLTKKPSLFIRYINNNISQEIIKSQNEIINDIINENIVPVYNNNLQYYTYEFKITEEEANQIEKAKEEFDKKYKEIKDKGNVKFVE